MHNRRNFLKGATAISAITLLKPGTAFGSKANSAIRIGFIGCGGRGSSVIQSMVKNTDSCVVALADLFEDKLQSGRQFCNKLNTEKGFAQIETTHVFQGSKAYLKLLELNDVDAVLISTPAYAHPQFLEAAVAAGKHVYCEKPLATDVAGVNQALKAGIAAQNRVSVAVGFQLRHASPYMEMVKRIRNGAIGEIVTAQLYYFCCYLNMPWSTKVSNDEARIRAHFWFNALSGGTLLDQGIHLLDFCNNTLNAHPVSAVGVANRRGKNDPGDCMSNYQLIYEYPNQTNVTLQTTQFGPEWSDVCMRFLGEKGFAEAHYSKDVFIKGENKWDFFQSKGGADNLTKEQKAAGFFSALDDADANKDMEFINSIKSGNFLNEVESAAQSTLTAIMGREATITGRKVTWDETMKSNNHIDPKLNLSQFDK